MTEVLFCRLAALIASGESTVVDISTFHALLLKVSLRSVMEPRHVYSSSLSVIWPSN